MRTLLLISGGKEAVPGILRARALGLRVAVFDGDPGAPGLAIADVARVVSTYDPEGAIAAARELRARGTPIDGVTAVGADVPQTTARVAEALGLPGLCTDAAALSADKLAMKRRLAAAGVPVPWFAPVGSAAELRQLALARGGPLVVKPVDSRGARGVTLLSDPLRSGFSFDLARAPSPGGRVMVEEYLEGPQVSTESLFQEGEALTIGFSDRNYGRMKEFAPYFIEDGGTLPSALEPAERAELTAAAEAAGRALGLETGVCKGDMVWSKGRAVVIEVALRLSGGWFCSDQVPLSTGVDFLGSALRLALGERLDLASLRPRLARAVATRYFFPVPGRVVACADPEPLRSTPWVHRLELDCAVGDSVEPVTDHTRRVGCVIALGEDRVSAVGRAEQVVSEIGIRTETPRGSVESDR